ncbi:MAG: hypothetical protein ACTSUE_15845 [Promethearchaeota archaeon]
MNQEESVAAIRTIFQDYIESSGKKDTIRITEVTASTRKNVGSLGICADYLSTIERFIREYKSTSSQFALVKIDGEPRVFERGDGVMARYVILFEKEALREYQFQEDSGDGSGSSSESDDGERFMREHEIPKKMKMKMKMKMRRRRRRRKNGMCSCTLFRLCLCFLIIMIVLFVLSKTL